MSNAVMADRYRQIIMDEMKGPQGYGRKGSKCAKKAVNKEGRKVCKKYKGGVSAGVMAGECHCKKGGVAVGGTKKQKIAAKHNPWIQHVKEFARQYGITYGEAMRDPKCSKSYHK